MFGDIGNRLRFNVSDLEWDLIKAAVELGLLYPNLGVSTRDEMPEREGTFHVAFILAPNFFLLPRRGASRSLSTIKSEYFKPRKTSKRLSKLELQQLNLFDRKVESEY